MSPNAGKKRQLTLEFAGAGADDPFAHEARPTANHVDL
jgi:hypothetical protein